MKTYIKTILFTLLLGVVTLGFAPTLQAATTTGGGDYGLTATAVASGLKSYGKDLPTLVGNIIGTALAMIGVFFFILVTYGGILWMTARGNDDIAKKALGTIIAAVIGMLIVLGAYGLTNFIINAVK